MRASAGGMVVIAATLAGVTACDDSLPIEPITEPGLYERTFEVDDRTRGTGPPPSPSWSRSTACPGPAGSRR
jgi:hypothetical protein